MAAFSAPSINASSHDVPFTVTQQTPFQSGNQTQWDPDSIGTIVFGVLMFFMATIALWQRRQRLRQREHDAEHGEQLVIRPKRGAEHGSGNSHEARTAGVMDSIPMAEILRGIGDWSAVDVRVSGQEGSETQGSENEIDLSFVPRIGQALLRADTDWTLVGDDDEAKEEGKEKDEDD
ncbi:hypothetical protein OEA41_008372 [Lepraria neglecta]|uniref:Transmembrane protein n=1 Tax=Lepraria neglecta TaxID=209136 RepID=A0AAD9ZEC1_9LECA|nr:hypothetical protein OEA41_008372 [Lepraria neglecta]